MWTLTIINGVSHALSTIKRGYMEIENTSLDTIIYILRHMR